MVMTWIVFFMCYVQIASKTAAMLVSIDEGDDDDSDVSLELTESEKELEMNGQPSRPTSSASAADIPVTLYQPATNVSPSPTLPTTLSVCASPEVASKSTENNILISEPVQSKAYTTVSPPSASSTVLPNMKTSEKDCVPITDSASSIPIQKTALAV